MHDSSSAKCLLTDLNNFYCVGIIEKISLFMMKNQKLFGKLWGRSERWAADVEPARSNVSLCERAQFPFLTFESLLADLKLRMETGRGASFQEGHQVQHKLHKCSLLKRHWWWKETWGISLHSPLYDIVAYIDNKNDKNGMYAHVCGLLQNFMR